MKDILVPCPICGITPDTAYGYGEIWADHKKNDCALSGQRINGWKTVESSTQRIFELRWDRSDYGNDGFSHYIFIHPTKTDDEFEADVEILLKKYGKEYIEQETGWVGAENWIAFISTKMVELGYQTAPIYTDNYVGAEILDDKYYDDKYWGEVVGKELYEVAIEHNNKLRMKLAEEKRNV